MGVSSLGGPGSMMMRHPLWAVKAHPGAVPLSFWNTWQPSGSQACFSWFELTFFSLK